MLLPVMTCDGAGTPFKISRHGFRKRSFDWTPVLDSSAGSAGTVQRVRTCKIADLQGQLTAWRQLQ